MPSVTDRVTRIWDISQGLFELLVHDPLDIHFKTLNRLIVFWNAKTFKTDHTNGLET